jgi:hypothetical protein
MKITDQHLATLTNLISNVKGLDDAVKRYEKGDFPRVELTKDVKKRFCFDVHSIAMINAQPDFMSDMYKYMDDDHIYTALKFILKDHIKGL